MKRPSLDVVEPDIDEVDEPLAIKYRPKLFKEVLGNSDIVASIVSNLKVKTMPRAWLLTGASGVGKTTIARLIAGKLKIDPRNMIEVDGASYGKIDDVRLLAETMQNAKLLNGERFVIVDECHALTKQAWQVLLKPIEEAGKGLYWVLCTTEGEKVPKTIKTRCQCYTLRPIDDDTLFDHLASIADAEEFKATDDVLEVVVDLSGGSTRQALQYLGIVKDCMKVNVAKELLEQAEASVPSIELIKLLCSGEKLSWSRVVKLMKKMEEENPESVRLNMVNYAAKVLVTTTNENKAIHILNVLEAFAIPAYSPEKFAPLWRALGRLVFDGE